jgi:hypothetical protein
MEYTPHHEEEFSIRCPRRADDLLEYNRSLLAQCEIDSLRSEVLNLRLERDTLRKIVPDGEWVSYADYQKVHDAASRLLVAINKRLPIGSYSFVCEEHDALQCAIYGKDTK